MTEGISGPALLEDDAGGCGSGLLRVAFEDELGSRAEGDLVICSGGFGLIGLGVSSSLLVVIKSQRNFTYS